MITHYLKEKRLLFDGPEAEILDIVFNPDGGPGIAAAIKLYDFTDNNFEKLPTLIGDAAFDLIIKTGGFISDDGFLNLYRGSYDLNLYYYKKYNIVFVLAYGEFQPGRYMLFVEGVWAIG